MASDICPCGSGEKYRLCCRPFHRGEKEPPTVDKLVRARFCAYALKEIDFLWKTLSPEHADKKSGDELEVKRVLRRGANALNFVRLQLLDVDQREPGELSRVLFVAEIFEKGKDHSLIEASNFTHDGTGWRYLSGVTRELKGMKDVGALRLDTFKL
ncbi:MAG: YchJ family protein [Myxococcaceae bacterium]